MGSTRWVLCATHSLSRAGQHGFQLAADSPFSIRMPLPTCVLRDVHPESSLLTLPSLILCSLLEITVNIQICYWVFHVNRNKCQTNHYTAFPYCSHPRPYLLSLLNFLGYLRSLPSVLPYALQIISLWLLSPLLLIPLWPVTSKLPNSSSILCIYLT